MVTTLELQRRGLPYAVVVDGAATPASLQALDRQGLPYLVEVADGATMASRRALESRGLRYLVPVLVDATAASKASLAAQGLRYAVQVDADILPADRLVLQRQGLAYYVKVDSSGNSVATAAGGGLLLVDETNGFAADFTHAVDAERVAVKTAGAVVYSGTSFFTNSGTSSKWVYNAAGVLVNIPAGTLPLDYDPVTHAARGLLVEPQATNLITLSSNMAGNWGTSGVTIVQDTTTSPAGVTEADTVTFGAGAGAYAYHQSAGSVTSGATYPFSVFARTASGTKKFRMGLQCSGTTYSSDFTATTTWQRFANTFTADATGDAYCLLANESAGGAGSVVFWGSQFESGIVATSPMPTAGVAVTRAADQVSVTSASINYSATAGSWWVDATPMALTGYPIIGFANGSASPSKVGSPTTLVMFDGTNTQKTVANSLADHKTAAAYAAGDRAFTADGLTVQVDVGSTTNLLNPGTIGFGSTPGVGASTGLMYIRKLRYVPRRKTNLELVTESA
jgi:hypothetical protein